MNAEELDEAHAAAVVAASASPALSATPAGVPADDDPRLRALAARIAALDDADHRSGRLAALLRSLEPELAAAAIDVAAHRSGEPAWRVLYLALVHVLLKVRPRPALQAGPLRGDHERHWPDGLEIAKLIGAASRDQRRFAQELLRATLQDPGPYDDRPLPPHVSIEHLPLGTRRQRARGPQRDLLLPLLVDTEPSVVELLARNPRLRQDDVLRLATNRRTHPWALCALLLAPRWLANATITLAVAHNPVCPDWLLLALAPLLPAAALQDVLRKRPLLGAAWLESVATLHHGALRAAIEAQVAQPLLPPPAVAWTVEDEPSDAALGMATSAVATADALQRALAEALALLGGARGEVPSEVPDAPREASRAAPNEVPGTSRAAPNEVPGTSCAAPNEVPGTSRAASGEVPGTSRAASGEVPGTLRASPGEVPGGVPSASRQPIPRRSPPVAAGRPRRPRLG